jgi:diguanylate cyclase (GGDEF)-like protein
MLPEVPAMRNAILEGDWSDSADWLEFALDLVSDLVLIAPSLDREIVYHNQAVVERLGYTARDLRSKRLVELIPGASRFHRAHDPASMIGVLRHQDGSELPMAVSFRRHCIGGRSLLIAAAQESLSQLDCSPLSSVEMPDALTQLPGRRTLFHLLQTTLEQTPHRQAPWAVLFVDVDYFKDINDGLGHVAGDGVLREFAQRLVDGTRWDDVVARFGGDEFVVLLSALQGRDELRSISRRIRRRIKMPMAICGYDICVSATIGGVVANRTHTSVEQLLHAADRAMYRAKRFHRRPTWRLARSSPLTVSRWSASSVDLKAQKKRD